MGCGPECGFQEEASMRQRLAVEVTRPGGVVADAPSLDGPVEIAPRVWWVGSMLPGDDFQCHVYLIEQGDQSVLIDPGSALTADAVVANVERVVGLDRVRWLVCTHSDPDIVGALPGLTADRLAPGAAIVTHWRSAALIRHVGTSLPFWNIEDHGWTLDLEDRRLRFVFTPYAHFAGAFCAYDESTGVLFSSDLFGGFTDDRTLFAESLDYFESMRSFHEHYMPGNQMLRHAIEQLDPLDLTMIAPQHGQIIRGPLVRPIMEQLRQLDCGIYLLAEDDPGLRFLLAANDALHDIVASLTAERSFDRVVARLDDLARAQLHTTGFELWARSGRSTFRYGPGTGFVGTPAPPDGGVLLALDGGRRVLGTQAVLPLRSDPEGPVTGAAVLDFDAPPELGGPVWELLEEIGSLVAVGLDRDVIGRVSEQERSDLYTRATRDQLTGLHNRHFLADEAARQCAMDDRDPANVLACLLLDIDHFKAINDTHGHAVGDLVLQHVAAAIAGAVRPSDVAVRFGGEEFVLVAKGRDVDDLVGVAERIRAAVATSSPDLPPVTASVGVARRRPGEAWDELVRRADAALYEAKRTGRDRVHVAA
jgi:diguanylate cyclase (GGDEF)-like protein